MRKKTLIARIRRELTSDDESFVDFDTIVQIEAIINEAERSWLDRLLRRYR